MIDLKPYYQVKLTLCRCMSYYLINPRKPRMRNMLMVLFKKRIGLTRKGLKCLIIKTEIS